MKKRLTSVRQLFLLMAIVATLVGCGDDEGPVDSKGNDPDLLGAWNMQSVNGQAPVGGVSLKWVFTAATVTWSSDMDCVTVIKYTAKDGKITGNSIVSSTGSQCGDDNDDSDIGDSFPYSVSGNKLTVTFTDPEISPPTAVFVFVKG